MTKELEIFLINSVKKLEQKRKRLVALQHIYRFTVTPLRFISKISIGILALVLIVFPPNILFMIIPVAAYFLLSYIPKPRQVYERYLKNHILPTVFREMNATFVYKPIGVNQNALDKSGIFNKSFFKNSNIIGEDYVKGTINNVAVEFSEVSFFKEKVNYSKTAGGFLYSMLSSFTEDNSVSSGDGENILIKDNVRIYKGFCLYADFHKDFSEKILLIPKKIQRFKDVFSENDYATIAVDNTYVQEKYKILSTDEQSAFYVLSPKFLETIAEILHKENVVPFLSFFDGKMLMTIPWDRDYFSTDLHKKVNDIGYFKTYIDEIESFTKIVSHFRLDQRIWTKQ